MGPGWRTAPSAGSSTVITEPSCTSCGWSSSSVPWRKISAHTSGSWSNTAVHSGDGLGLDRVEDHVEQRAPLLLVVEVGDVLPLRVVEHPVELEHAHERRGTGDRVVCENCNQRPSFVSATARR